MKIWLIRHGATEFNKERRYQGQTDIPLSEEGCLQLTRSQEPADRVYVSHLRRTAQTARILFPEAELVPVPGLAEMDFGTFEGRTHQEMDDDPDYQRWIDSGGYADIPGGESRAVFSARIRRTLEELIRQSAGNAEEKLLIVAHGGTVMAAMEWLMGQADRYYEWLPGNGEGYELEVTEDSMHKYLTEADCPHPECRILRKLEFHRLPQQDA